MSNSLAVTQLQDRSSLPLNFRMVAIYFWSNLHWVVVWNIFCFHPYLGKIPILTNNLIFFKWVEATNQFIVFPFLRLLQEKKLRPMMPRKKLPAMFPAREKLCLGSLQWCNSVGCCHVWLFHLWVSFCQVPTLVIHGQKDRLIDSSQGGVWPVWRIEWRIASERIENS